MSALEFFAAVGIVACYAVLGYLCRPWSPAVAAYESTQHNRPQGQGE